MPRRRTRLIPFLFVLGPTAFAIASSRPVPAHAVSNHGSSGKLEPSDHFEDEYVDHPGDDIRFIYGSRYPWPDLSEDEAATPERFRFASGMPVNIAGDDVYAEGDIYLGTREDVELREQAAKILGPYHYVREGESGADSLARALQLDKAVATAAPAAVQVARWNRVVTLSAAASALLDRLHATDKAANSGTSRAGYTDAAVEFVALIDSLRGPRAFAVVTELGGLWEGPIEYDLSSFPSGRRAEFLKAVQHWKDKTGLRFDPRKPSSVNYIKVVDEGGCSSYVGQKGGAQRMSLSSGCSYGAMIHEIGHAVGLFHEQGHPDRDQFVKINWHNIKPRARRNFRTISSPGRVSAYDYGSVMHYSTRAFSIGDNKLTIEPIKPLPPGVRKIGQRDGLSEIDIQTVKALYRR